MTARRRPGRPKLAARERSQAIVAIRFKPEEKRELEAAAKAADLSLSTWVRQQLIESARKAQK